MVILEEPEHLNWYHHGKRWSEQFTHVVGIAHTNYLQYAKLNTEGVVKSGELKAGFLKVMNNVVCAAHTDLVVKLSPTLPDLPGQNLVCNVHGVRSEFLAIGAAAAERQRKSGGETAWPGGGARGVGAYFLCAARARACPIFYVLPRVLPAACCPLPASCLCPDMPGGVCARLVPVPRHARRRLCQPPACAAVPWHGMHAPPRRAGGHAPRRARRLAHLAAAPRRRGKAMFTKGYLELIEAMRAYEAGGHDAPGGELPQVDTYGSGQDYEQIVARVDAEGLPINVNPGIDHAHPTLHGYRVFVNPSTSDVLCTATAEALAMGKKVIIPDHPSNVFFKQFTNTIMYDDPSELVPLLREALASEPTPMSRMEAYMLSWDAASERLLDAAALPQGTERGSSRVTSKLAYGVHYLMGVQPIFDGFRIVTGAPPVRTPRERVDRAVRALRVTGRRTRRGDRGAAGTALATDDDARRGDGDGGSAAA